MADLSFSIRPIELADALYNGVLLAGDALGLPGCPHVLISYQKGSDGRGAVAVYGVSRIIAGRTTIPLDTVGPDDYASVAITRAKADEVQSLLRSYGRAKSTMIGVRLCEDGYDTVEFGEDDEPDVRTVHFAITKGEDTVVELAESDPEGHFGTHWDLVDQWATSGNLTGPTAFTFEAVKRVTGLKGLGSTAMDLAQTENANVIALAAGRHFRGVIGKIDREAYMTAGDRAGHLLQ